MLSPGGVLAFQIPDTRVQPSHLLMETAAENLDIKLNFAFSNNENNNENQEVIRIPRCEHDPEYYYDLVIPKCEDVNLWSTEYCQILEGDNAVYNYTTSTGIKPILNYLGGKDTDLSIKYLEEYKKLVNQQYPQQANGKTLFPFKRFFLVCTKKEE
eukprot:TRINITY_DN3058_c0_g1_i1.p1 TRINITY_DN3058_c0_g1~~TRINITY_DN3058_c0_g1_i1.p1  ORF type:complete len:156 (-),score=48.63 TRINITY_DN3058_c0_g1_i1:83-550(-)